jgi:hypothetical protein
VFAEGRAGAVGIVYEGEDRFAARAAGGSQVETGTGFVEIDFAGEGEV